MDRPLRIAMFVGMFPVVSETFILRQITGLLDLGHEVDVFADTRVEPGSPQHSEVAKYQLLRRTTFMDMPPETAPYEMPVWPFMGRTWPPGSPTSVHNSVRVFRALPRLLRCMIKSPRLTFRVLSRAEYGYQAESLSALYRLAKLAASPHGYDVLHAHYGPVGKSFRFARALLKAPLMVTDPPSVDDKSPKSQGRPRHPRPTTTPSQPVSAIICTASAASQMSPFPSTGIVETASLSRRIESQSAVPE
jgi:colanic acid/amylovoran biosynthesis glycosyltransferase